MGMFSWNCLACGFSLRECRGCSEGNWMSEGVCLTPGGSRVIGYYDGYGQLGGDYNLGHQIDRKFSIYHKACWELVGKPEYTQPSAGARDQGACHALHGQPLPKPATMEVLDQYRMWNALERVLDAWSRLKCDLELAECERLAATLTEAEQVEAFRQYEVLRESHREIYRLKMEAWYSSPDEEAPMPKEVREPDLFEFAGREFDWGWFGVLAARFERGERKAKKL